MASEPPKLRVLLVEDESLVAIMVMDMLAHLGHEVIGPATRLQQAIEMAQREAFDLAILDINLQGTESYPVADVLAVRGIPFVFATGYESLRLRKPFADRPLLQKPFYQDDLQKGIAQACADSHGAT